MKCYVIEGNYGKPDFADYVFARAPDHSERIHWNDHEGEWVPDRDMQYEHGGPMSYGATVNGGRFTEQTRKKLRNLWCVSRSKHARPFNVIKAFDESLVSIPLISEAFKIAIEAASSDLFEFMLMEQIWDDTHKQPIAGGPFFLANLLVRRDCWDQERTKIVPQKRGDGSFFNVISSSSNVVLRSRIEGDLIWRDTLTMTVVCTDTFKEIADAVGCGGWWFREINVTDDR
ncbi:hypothetical protein ROA7450_03611 [Roseovarius albus]|uniref:Immunity MXAN-0049 protein domain-containing protein n=1 Tax=Roseovarius albus TaxID=1247867 RepID=A0A1X7A1M7_9RHOB|nr:DUF1629 domain-containing protein [Roseovarius albus]SLN67513.1 hypothetical protein ROA7450_03611 [Roseovarius albus]